MRSKPAVPRASQGQGDTTMATTLSSRDPVSASGVTTRAEERKGGVKRKNEFVLALSIFVAMSVIGTAFGLWMVGMYSAKPAGSPPTVEGQAPKSQVPPVESARPDPATPAEKGVSNP